MISIQTIAERLTEKLNALAPDNTEFVIMGDGGTYVPSARKARSNDILYRIDGEADIISSTITPVNGIIVATETVGVSVCVPINKVKGFDESVRYIREAISTYMSTPDVFSYTVADNKGAEQTYTVTMYGSQPEAGSREIRQGYGDSIDYNWVCNFSVVQNGVNSQNQSVTFEGEQIPFTSLVLVRAPSTDGGAFSNTNGVAKSWHSSTALQVTVTVPALTNNTLTKEFADYVINGVEKVYDVVIKFSELTVTDEQGNATVKENTKRMIFDVGNITAQEINNVGMEINLLEYFEV
jgi:hypothetical protein